MQARERSGKKKITTGNNCCILMWLLKTTKTTQLRFQSVLCILRITAPPALQTYPKKKIKHKTYLLPPPSLPPCLHHLLSSLGAQKSSPNLRHIILNKPVARRPPPFFSSENLPADPMGRWGGLPPSPPRGGGGGCPRRRRRRTKDCGTFPGGTPSSSPSSSTSSCSSLSLLPYPLR